MKKIISSILIISLSMMLISCTNSSTENNSSESLQNSSSLSENESSSNESSSSVISQFSSSTTPTHMTELDTYLNIANKDGILSQNFNSPMELDTNRLVDFYGYSILYLSENPAGWGGPEEIKSVPFETVKMFVEKNFGDITDENLKKSELYNIETNTFDFNDRYSVNAEGFDQIQIAINSRTESDEQFIVTYNSIFLGQPIGEGVVTLKTQGDSFQFISNQFSDNRDVN